MPDTEQGDARPRHVRSFAIPGPLYEVVQAHARDRSSTANSALVDLVKRGARSLSRHSSARRIAEELNAL